MRAGVWMIRLCFRRAGKKWNEAKRDQRFLSTPIRNLISRPFQIRAAFNYMLWNTNCIASEKKAGFQFKFPRCYFPTHSIIIICRATCLMSLFPTFFLFLFSMEYEPHAHFLWIVASLYSLLNGRSVYTEIVPKVSFFSRISMPAALSLCNAYMSVSTKWLLAICFSFHSQASINSKNTYC